MNVISEFAPLLAAAAPVLMIAVINACLALQGERDTLLFPSVSMAVELRDAVVGLAKGREKLGYRLGCGQGIAQGFATIGTIGFPGRQDYGVVGAVNNLAARLCGRAEAGQVLISQRVHGRLEGRIVAEPVGELPLKGLQSPVPAFNVISVKFQVEVAK